jgi:hypothetical protein
LIIQFCSSLVLGERKKSQFNQNSRKIEKQKMTSFARTEILERKVEKHMREHANEMKFLRSELQTLKMRPSMRQETAVKDQRPLNDANKKLTHMASVRNKMTPPKSLKKAHNDDKSLNTNNYYSGGDDGDKMTNNNVNKMKMVSADGETTLAIFTSSER